MDLRAKSRLRPSNRYLSLDKCGRLLAVLHGRDHRIIRMLIQLGLRREELFALRYDDLRGDDLIIDEALVEGKSAETKTEASAATVYVPPDLAQELRMWIDSNPGQPNDFLFQHGVGRPGFMNANNFRNRVLKPAAIKAGVGVYASTDKDGHAVSKTDVDYLCLRRTCATHFGHRAKDPRSTQAQLRHADPTITLRHYQQAIPAAVKAAAIAFEADLGFGANASVQ